MLSKFLRASVNNTTNPSNNTDANFKQVSLLLHGDGTNGAQNNTFLDSSTNNLTITRSGTTTQGTFTPFSQDAGYWSNYFPTASYLTVATNAAFTYGTGDFTMECWVYLTTTGAIQYIIDQRNSGTANAVIPAIYVSASNVLTYFVSNAAQITGTTTLTTGTWHHVAVSRSTLVTKMFLNGVQEGSNYVDANNYAASRVVINSNAATAGNYLVGYTSNVRLVKGTAVYTANFTPSTTPLTAISGTSLLTCQSNRFVDNSSNNFAITRTGTPSVQPFSPFAPTSAYSTSVNGGSLYVPSTSSVTSAASSSYSLTGNFTIECWANIPAGTSQTTYAQIILSGGANQGLHSNFLGATNNFYMYNIGGNVASGVISNDGAWHHLAIVRNGSTVTFYVDGISRGTTTTSATINFGTSTGPRIGSGNAVDNHFTGFISDVRIVNGTAVYTANFTPPTAPLTAIANTSLLLNATNAGIFDNAEKNNLITVGNAQVSTSVKKFGTGSMYFDGTGDYLSCVPTAQVVNFGSANFTVEYWVYLTTGTAVNNYRQVIGGNSLTNNGLGFGFLTSSNTIYATTLSTGYNTGVNCPLNSWNHIAWVRIGTTVTCYLNGTLISTFTGVSLSYSDTGAMISSATYTFPAGYIDDLRVTNGVARYTANFTPPTQAFPNQ
jgi:hypothetical protein